MRQTLRNLPAEQPTSNRGPNKSAHANQQSVQRPTMGTCTSSESVAAARSASSKHPEVEGRFESHKPPLKSSLKPGTYDRSQKTHTKPSLKEGSYLQARTLRNDNFKTKATSGRRVSDNTDAAQARGRSEHLAPYMTSPRSISANAVAANSTQAQKKGLLRTLKDFYIIGLPRKDYEEYQRKQQQKYGVSSTAHLFERPVGAFDIAQHQNQQQGSHSKGAYEHEYGDIALKLYRIYQAARAGLVGEDLKSLTGPRVESASDIDYEHYSHRPSSSAGDAVHSILQALHEAKLPHQRQKIAEELKQYISKPTHIPTEELARQFPSNSGSSYGPDTAPAANPPPPPAVPSGVSAGKRDGPIPEISTSSRQKRVEVSGSRDTLMSDFMHMSEYGDVPIAPLASAAGRVPRIASADKTPFRTYSPPRKALKPAPLHFKKEEYQPKYEDVSPFTPGKTPRQPSNGYMSARSVSPMTPPPPPIERHSPKQIHRQTYFKSNHHVPAPSGLPPQQPLPAVPRRYKFEPDTEDEADRHNFFSQAADAYAKSHTQAHATALNKIKASAKARFSSSPASKLVSRPKTSPRPETNACIREVVVEYDNPYAAPSQYSPDMNGEPLAQARNKVDVHGHEANTTPPLSDGTAGSILNYYASIERQKAFRGDHR